MAYMNVLSSNASIIGFMTNHICTMQYIKY